MSRTFSHLLGDVKPRGVRSSSRCRRFPPPLLRRHAAWRARVRVPGDKSISHRYALLGALADGRSQLTNYAPGADCRSTLACLRQLGVEMLEDTHGAITVLGRGSAALSSPNEALDCGNSGTTMRLLAGILAAQRFSSRLIGRFVAVAPADDASDDAARADGRPNRGNERMRPARHPRRAIARDCPSARRCRARR